MQTSEKGIKFLERHEGVVLKAYRDPVGVWTIGAGLTKSSGVVAPKAGMVISKIEASNLLQQALKRNYEPAVNKAMAASKGAAKQNEFDGAVSFHWNTGAIGKASWVKSWRARDWPGVHRGLLNWIRGGGKIMPGLKRRREEEYSLIKGGFYSSQLKRKTASGLATFAVPYAPSEIAALKAAFRKLGYDPGTDKRGLPRPAVIKYQSDHALTRDGVIGRATLSSVRRMIDAKKKIKAPAAIGAVAATDTQTGVVRDQLSGMAMADWIVWIGLALAACWLIWLAVTYRDAVAVKLQSRFPKLASILRSF